MILPLHCVASHRRLGSRRGSFLEESGSVKKTEHMRMGRTTAKKSWQVSLLHRKQCSLGLGVSSPFVWVRAKRTRAGRPGRSICGGLGEEMRLEPVPG